jgi:hypothetical protein
VTKEDKMIKIQMTPGKLPVNCYSNVTIHLSNQTKDSMFSAIVLDIEVSPPIRIIGRRSIRIDCMPPNTEFNHNIKLFIPQTGDYVLRSNNFSFRDDMGNTHRYNLKLPISGIVLKEKSTAKTSDSSRRKKQRKKPLSVFISYAHSDEGYLEKLKKHLSSLRRNGFIKDWSDGCILPGDDWQKKIDSALKKADLVILLVSSDFLYSYYCYEKEFSVALELQKKGDLRIIPVILRDCQWRNTPFAAFNALPRRGAIPITLFSNEDTGFREVADGIADLVR